MAKNNYSLGIILIAVAIILLLGKLGVFSFLGYMLWPLVVLIPGLLLHYLYFSRTLPVGVVVPGGILVTYSIMFFYCNLFGWSSMKYLWPGYIFGVAVGLYELQLFDRNSRKGVWTASIILAAISAVFFGISFLMTIGIYMIALILIVAGLVIVLRKPKTW